MSIKDYPYSQQLASLYRSLLKVCPPTITNEDRKLIRKAFYFSAEAHKDMKRTSGEPYVYHPINVSIIVAKEIGLGTKSIVSALLHDVIEDTDYTYEDIKVLFGEKIAKIVDGLTKITSLLNTSSDSQSYQAENFRKVLLTLSDDVRVILIKIADRLHNMRTLDSLSKEKKVKILSETSYLYAPLAHRLGLFEIKNELEDLSLKYAEPDIYKTISKKIIQTEKTRKKLIGHFIVPIKTDLEKAGIKFEILSRLKSISSIWNKMKKKQIPFEEIYDIFAVRIIIDSTIENEKSDCWKIYSIITNIYRPNPERLRDWLSIPKANGYESLHTTVMSHEGKWIEVQIRTRRMDEIAEKGYAAHWKYKNQVENAETSLDLWLNKIKETLSDPSNNALDFLDDIKMNLFSEEIYIFTPKGEMKTLPKNSTALDFAYSIHSEIGNKCIGAKVNHTIMPLNHILKSGDQVEILSSDNQTLKKEWLDFVTTARAKMQIKRVLKDFRKKSINDGIKMLHELFIKLKIKYTDENINMLQKHFNYKTRNDLYFDVANKIITIDELKSSLTSKTGWLQYFTLPFNKLKILEKQLKKHSPKVDNKKIFVYDSNLDVSSIIISDCCNPIPGDEIIGFYQNKDILVHKTICKKSISQSSTFGNKITKVSWNKNINMLFLAKIKIIGIDKLGLIKDLSNLMSGEMNINIRSFHLEVYDEVFEGEIELLVSNYKHLKEIISEMKNIEGVKQVIRI